MRALETAVLNDRAKFLVANWHMNSSQKSKTRKGFWISGPEFVVQEIERYRFMDEQQHVIAAIEKRLASDDLQQFKAAVAKIEPWDPKEHEANLAEWLAIDPAGKHIDGKIGRTVVGSRDVGAHVIEVEHPYSIKTRKYLKLGKDWSGRQVIRKLQPLRWPVYAGEDIERERDSGVADPLPPPMMTMAAADFTISNECALLGLDAIVDNLDEGAGAAVIQGRTGVKPADVDTAVSGTLLFTCVMTDPAFGAAADDTPGAIATAAAISDDTSADATDALGYCRVSSTADGATPADDHMDLNADTSGGDINFNTLSIVSGGTVSISSFTVSLPEQA